MLHYHFIHYKNNDLVMEMLQLDHEVALGEQWRPPVVAAGTEPEDVLTASSPQTASSTLA